MRVAQLHASRASLSERHHRIYIDAAGAWGKVEGWYNQPSSSYPAQVRVQLVQGIPRKAYLKRNTIGTVRFPL
jgi:hypothetical protein